MRKVFDSRVSKHGLTTARAYLLKHLAANEGATQTELAAALQVEQPSMIGLVDGLEKTGWVSRCAVKGDRRAKAIYLTAHGRQEMASISAFASDLRSQLLAGIDKDDMVVALRVLDSIVDNIEDCEGRCEEAGLCAEADAEAELAC
ncbi:MarR family winged helix-turn-helix transcriptional regulator [Corticibacterium sp. UT-5YL-CI-8]|nr:MarR family winged helix-turn-helix transcriptional regulator [Tianweitania sp. UT-5YL-CI-8]